MGTRDLRDLSAWSADLMAEVDRVFVATGASAAGWPDPHQGRAPAEEEYSRCLDPLRYRILDARIDAWVHVLIDLDLARAHEELPSSLPWVGAVRSPDAVRRVLRIEPTVADGLSLLLAHTLVDGEPFGIDVGVAVPQEGSLRPAQIATVPPCGCDACDDGSEALLDELDGWFVVVAVKSRVVV